VADVSLAEGNSGSRTVTFSLRLSQATTVPVSVDFAFRNGSATLGSDVTPNGAGSGRFTIPANASEAWITATVYGDTNVEEDETVFLDLSNRDGVTFRGGGTTLTATATIVNDDSAAQVDPNLGIAITSGGNFSGTNRNDLLTGDDGVNRIDGLDGNDVITGGLGADPLLSGNGADRFVYRSFAESSFAFGVDATDAVFANGDRIDLSTRPTALANVGLVSATSLAAAFANARADVDRITAGNQPLAIGAAVMFNWGATTRGRRTYLAVADADTATDSGDFLFMTNQTQNAIGSLDVQAFFV
jgi:Ca2+-binding RTX toxin-like protein